MERGCRTGSLRRDNTPYPWYKRCMSRRRRRQRQKQLPAPQPTWARPSGAKAGALFLFLFGFFETVGPTLCRQEPTGLVASDGGADPSSPVPVETWADAAWGERLGRHPFPPPAPGQQRPPCPAGTVEGTGACWQRTDRKPPCNYYEVEDGGACYMAVPKMPGSPEKHPLSSPP